MKRATNVAVVFTAALIMVLAVNLVGQSFGRWGTPTRSVTIICLEDAGKMHCASTPVKVRR